MARIEPFSFFFFDPDLLPGGSGASSGKGTGQPLRQLAQDILNDLHAEESGTAEKPSEQSPPHRLPQFAGPRHRYPLEAVRGPAESVHQEAAIAQARKEATSPQAAQPVPAVAAGASRFPPVTLPKAAVIELQDVNKAGAAYHAAYEAHRDQRLLTRLADNYLQMLADFGTARAPSARDAALQRWYADAGQRARVIASDVRSMSPSLYDAQSKSLHARVLEVEAALDAATDVSRQLTLPTPYQALNPLIRHTPGEGAPALHGSEHEKMLQAFDRGMTTFRIWHESSGLKGTVSAEKLENLGLALLQLRRDTYMPTRNGDLIDKHVQDIDNAINRVLDKPMTIQQ